MRYHFEKPDIYRTHYGETYICDHPVYNRCTLFRIGDKGLAVIQQRYNPETKETRWTEIDPWLTDAIYLNPGFKKLFMTHGGAAGGTTKLSTDSENGLIKSGKNDSNIILKSSTLLYPTLTVRQVMWALKMKPLKREPWETVFDRKPI